MRSFRVFVLFLLLPSSRPSPPPSLLLPELDSLRDTTRPTPHTLPSILPNPRPPRAPKPSNVNVLRRFSEKISVSSARAVELAFGRVGKAAPYITVLNSTHVSVHSLSPAGPSRPLAAFGVQDGRRVTSGASLTAVQTAADGALVVLKLADRTLTRAQTLQLPANVSAFVIWKGHAAGVKVTGGGPFLAASTRTEVALFEWLGEHFDRIQTVASKAAAVVPLGFRDGSAFLTVSRSGIVVFDFVLAAGRFSGVQRLPGARAARGFSVRKRRGEERFVCACSEERTVVYKEAFGRFVPFQGLRGAEHCVPVVRGDSAVLLLMAGGLAAFQYDGWRFVELDDADRDNFGVGEVGEIRADPAFEGDVVVADVGRKRWRVMGPEWRVVDSWRHTLAEAKAWCEAKRAAAGRTGHFRDDPVGEVKAAGLRVENLVVQDPGDDIGALRRASGKYRAVREKLKHSRATLAGLRSADNLRFSGLAAKAAKSRRCRARRVESDPSNGPKFSDLSGLRRVSESPRSLNFENVRAEFADSVKCPRPGFVLRETFARGDYRLRELVRDTLKTSGDQEVAANHEFDRLKTGRANFSVELSRAPIRQELFLPTARAESLEITDGGLFLPTGADSLGFSGSLRAAKVTLNGTVDLIGRFKGAAFEDLLPTVVAAEATEFRGEFKLRNATVTNFMRTDEIWREDERSPANNSKSESSKADSNEFKNPLAEILRNAVGLTQNLTFRVTLNAALWHDLTLPNLTFVTPASKIRSTKIVPRSVTLTRASNPPVPVLRPPFCAPTITTPSLKQSSLTLNALHASNVTAVNVYEDGALNAFASGLAPSWQSVDLLKKSFGSARVKSLVMSDEKSSRSRELKEVSSRWSAPNVFTGPVRAGNFLTDALRGSVRFALPLPTRAARARCAGDLEAGRLNAAKLAALATLRAPPSSLKLAAGLSCNDLRAAIRPASGAGFKSNLGAKRILGDFSAVAIEINQVFDYLSANGPRSFVLAGSALFAEEPEVARADDFELGRVREELWTAEADFLAGNVTFSNATFDGAVRSAEQILGSWIRMAEEDRLLSRTAEQTVDAAGKFGKTVFERIVGGEKARLRVKTEKCDDLMWNSLMNRGTQVVDSQWRLEKLRAEGPLAVNGKVNGLNLTSDFVRHDASVNAVSGAKEVAHLAAKRLDHQKFADWAADVVAPQDPDLIVVKGAKVFSSVDINKLTVAGTVSGRLPGRMLRKSGAQVVQGRKTIVGSIDAPSIRVESLVNDVNVSSLAEDQLKRNASGQRVKAEVVLKDGLEVAGHVRANGSYQSAGFKDADRKWRSLEPAAKKMADIAEVAMALDYSVQRHAVFARKLEADTNATSEANCEEDDVNSAIICLNETTSDPSKNASIARKMSSGDSEIFVRVNGSSILIYAAASGEEVSPIRVADLSSSPTAADVSVEASGNSLWTILKLPTEMLAVRYDLVGDLRTYALPFAKNFRLRPDAISGELQLIRSDGMWTLSGLGGPRRRVEVPLDRFFGAAQGHCFKMAGAGNATLRIRYAGS